MALQDAPRDSGVCSARDLDSLEVVLDAKAGEESGAERFFSGPAAGEKCAVDIEEEQDGRHGRCGKQKPTREAGGFLSQEQMDEVTFCRPASRASEAPSSTDARPIRQPDDETPEEHRCSPRH